MSSQTITLLKLRQTHASRSQKLTARPPEGGPTTWPDLHRDCTAASNAEELNRTGSCLATPLRGPRNQVTVQSAPNKRGLEYTRLVGVISSARSEQGRASCKNSFPKPSISTVVRIKSGEQGFARLEWWWCFIRKVVEPGLGLDFPLLYPRHTHTLVPSECTTETFAALDRPCDDHT